MAEKSTRALLVEVVRLQATVDAVMKSVDDERAARRDAENRMRAAADTLTQLGAQLERRRRTDVDDDAATAKTLLATAQNAEAAALAAKQETVKRVDEQADRY